jgi:hypothetical protein
LSSSRPVDSSLTSSPSHSGACGLWSWGRWLAWMRSRLRISNRIRKRIVRHNLLLISLFLCSRVDILVSSLLSLPCSCMAIGHHLYQVVP